MARVEAEILRTIRSVGPDLRRETKWGQPWFAGRDLVVVVGAFSRHVGAEFWRGRSLRDPTHLLEGTGKNLRHVKLRAVREASAPAMVALLREAIRLDQREPKRVR
ncbi:MAG: DUF1801 domain-containing protein [Thermoplasmata archaeon]